MMNLTPGPTQYSPTQPRQVRKEATVGGSDMCRGVTWRLIKFNPE